MYFDHSTTAATDPKVMQLRLEQGGAAVDAYWYMLEQMHRDECGICTSNAGAMLVHSHTLCTDENKLKTWVDAMVSIGLFEHDSQSGEITSPRAVRNISEYKEKSEKARSKAKSRWSNATAMQQQCSSNAAAMQTQCQQNKTKQKVVMPLRALLPCLQQAARRRLKPRPPLRGKRRNARCANRSSTATSRRPNGTAPHASKRTRTSS